MSFSDYMAMLLAPYPRIFPKLIYSRDFLLSLQETGFMSKHEGKFQIKCESNCFNT